MREEVLNCSSRELENLKVVIQNHSRDKMEGFHS